MVKNLKYKISKESILVGKKTLYRIKALKDFGDVKKNELGGFIEKEYNLSHDENCWIYDNAKVYGDARIYGDAYVSGNAEVSDNAQVSDNAKVVGNARVYGDTVVFGNVQISDNAQVYGDAMVYCNTKLFGNACVSGNAKVYGEAWVYGDAHVFGKARVFGDVQVYGGVWPISPFYAQISKRSVSSCSYTHLKIGYQIHTFEEWKQLDEKIGKENEYSDYEIAFYTKTIELAEKYIELAKMEDNNG